MRLPPLLQAWQSETPQFISDYGKLIAVEQQPVATVACPSGKFVAVDPYTLSREEDFLPFEHQVEPGDYPVSLGIATIEGMRDDGPYQYPMNAYALVHLSPEKPVTWTMATTPGQDVDSLIDDEFFGYGVDCGLGCFMDVAAARLLAQRNALNSEFRERLARQVREDQASILIDEAAGLNIVSFNAGIGDGSYASYWGLDANGRPACLLTDFSILTLPNED